MMRIDITVLLISRVRRRTFIPLPASMTSDGTNGRDQEYIIVLEGFFRESDFWKRLKTGVSPGHNSSYHRRLNALLHALTLSGGLCTTPGLSCASSREVFPWSARDP